MADKFDPYRESLVMEQNTIWPEEYRDWDASRRARVELALHAEPQHCAALEYVRVHTGFCRQVTVTAGDVERIG